uniref:Uncharacterized protein n=1 Tax=Triticum urartu TaxID=4572 RepID=A0A8R7PMC7_TRIUA
MEALCQNPQPHVPLTHRHTTSVSADWKTTGQNPNREREGKKRDRTTEQNRAAVQSRSRGSTSV